MTNAISNVGFIGIGTMGWPMAANLVKAGFNVTVFDLSSERSQRFAREVGGKATDSLADIARQQLVVTMLPTGKIVREVLLHGQHGAFASNAKAGTLVVDMSSSEPTGTRELAAELARQGVVFIDAPVSGAEPRAKAGTLTIMIGGNDADAIARARLVLGAMGNRLFDTGGSGSGHACKALNNLLGATAFAATSEAVLVAERFGLDPKVLVDILNVSTGKSFISEIVMKDHVLDGKFATGFKLGLMAKDVQIAVDLADAVGLAAPVAHQVNERWKDALNRLGFDADNTEAIKSWKGGDKP
ncbi:MAG TPA: NAD(P)-dependent oxidoreductase [Candidatus Acidoferrum sp.]|nr:NAD(P)-dependent oxidoreductase [Candidatus Acidoferrum sp.]